MNSINDSFTAHLGLAFFLARCILLTGLSLIPVCTSPLIRALRFDSPDWQLQWRDTGGTVGGLTLPPTEEFCPLYITFNKKLQHWQWVERVVLARP